MFLPFSLAILITPFEKQEASLSASSSSQGFVMTISGRSLYEAVAVEPKEMGFSSGIPRRYASTEELRGGGMH